MQEANAWRLLLNAKGSMQPLSIMQSLRWVNFHNAKVIHGGSPARKLFAGDVHTTNDIQRLDVIAYKRIGVVGLGKVAVSVVLSAVERVSKVEHVPKSKAKGDELLRRGYDPDESRVTTTLKIMNCAYK